MYKKGGEREEEGVNDSIRISGEEVKMDDLVACCIEIKGEEPIG